MVTGAAGAWAELMAAHDSMLHPVPDDISDTAAVLAEIAALKGDGGMIAIDADGHVATPFVSEGMKRAVLERDGTLTSAAF